MSSFDYARIIESVKQERTEAVAKAIEIAPEIAQLNARKTINIEPQIFAEALKKVDMSETSTAKGHSSVLEINDSGSHFSGLESERRTHVSSLI